ncbi:hypothetical protein V8017_10705 [Stenotrophomonas rhizophila]
MMEGLELPTITNHTPDLLATDEAWWANVRALYDLDDAVVMLDNGYWGAMARPVLQAYQQATATVNAGNAWFGRRAFPPCWNRRARIWPRCWACTPMRSRSPAAPPRRCRS